MEANFWHKKWQAGEIGFHLPEANPLFVTHFPQMNLQPGSRVFIPLCGKTRDIAWLLSQSYKVCGAELSELAIMALFEELGVTPTITQHRNMKHYQAENLDIYVGDIFELKQSDIGQVDAIYDRAALVALPEEMRNAYSKHLTNLCSYAPQLLITFEYDQSAVAGPPFSISSDEVLRHYDDLYTIRHLSQTEVVGGLKGLTPAQESVWLIRKKSA